MVPNAVACDPTFTHYRSDIIIFMVVIDSHCIVKKWIEEYTTSIYRTTYILRRRIYIKWIHYLIMVVAYPMDELGSMSEPNRALTKKNNTLIIIIMDKTIGEIKSITRMKMQKSRQTCRNSYQILFAKQFVLIINLIFSRDPSYRDIVSVICRCWKQKHKYVTLITVLFFNNINWKD